MRLAKKLVLILIVLLIFYGANNLVLNYLEANYSHQGNQDNTEVRTEERTDSKLKKVNILIAGLDQAGADEGMTDNLMLLQIDYQSEKIDLLSVPRDTKVDSPKLDLVPAKINSAYAVGGIDLTAGLVEELVELEIDSTVVIDYAAFVNIIDLIGGVELLIEDDIYYRDQSADLEIDFKAGKQFLTGEQSLEYVRYRDQITGDIGRIKRQQEFLTATKSGLLKADNILKLPEMVVSIYSNLETDLNLRDLWQLSLLLHQVDSYQIETSLLAGEAKLIDGISYWITDNEI